MGATCWTTKEALYADAAVADACTGAFKLHAAAVGALAMEVQLARGAAAPATADRLVAATHGRLSPSRVVWRPYDEFRHGMGLDYERKFNYVSAA